MEIDRPNQDKSVLSIQSWVTHGYVGNKCSVYALQLLGIEVDPLLTVQFSNHTGYPSWKGQIFDGEQLYEIFEGLMKNDLINYTHLLTGYMNSATSLRTTVKIFNKLKTVNPNLQYFCDPVLGDNGKLYVSEELVKIYKEEIIKHANCLLPNQTECEYLTGIKITVEKEAIDALNIFHDMGIPTVIIKSLFHKEETITILGSTIITSEIDGKRKEKKQLFKVIVPRYPRYFSGTGDLFASLFLAWTAKGFTVIQSCEKTINTLHAILDRTFSCNSDELKLIQSRQDIESPPNVYQLQLLN